MEKNNRFAQLLLSLYGELLEEENLETALAGSLELLVSALKSEAGAIWLLDRDTNRLVPMFHMGPVDLSNFSVEMGTGAESYVTRTGESLCLNSPAEDTRFSGTLLDENGLPVQSMICVPLNNLHQIVGCLQIVNKKDGPYAEDELRLCERMAALEVTVVV